MDLKNIANDISRKKESNNVFANNIPLANNLHSAVFHDGVVGNKPKVELENCKCCYARKE